MKKHHSIFGTKQIPEYKRKQYFENKNSFFKKSESKKENNLMESDAQYEETDSMSIYDEENLEAENDNAYNEAKLEADSETAYNVAELETDSDITYNETELETDSAATYSETKLEIDRCDADNEAESEEATYSEHNGLNPAENHIETNNSNDETIAKDFHEDMVKDDDFDMDEYDKYVRDIEDSLENEVDRFSDDIEKSETNFDNDIDQEILECEEEILNDNQDEIFSGTSKKKRPKYEGSMIAFLFKGYGDKNLNKQNKKDKQKNPIFAKFVNMTYAERACIAMGLVVIVAISSLSVFAINTNARAKEIASFASLGADIEAMNVIGEDGLLAVEDAQIAKKAAADAATESSSEEEEEDGIVINMSLSTIKQDLKIKFLNKENAKLVSGIPFEVSVTKPDGTTTTWTDDDKDGIIYHSEITAGQYTVKMIELEGDEYEDYTFNTESQKITVKETIEYKAVDVADEIKTESEVNVSAEDTQVQDTVVESVNTDTVEWVESTKTEVGSNGTTTYEAIDKSTIVNPYDSARVNIIYGNITLMSAVDGENTDGANTAATATTYSLNPNSLSLTEGDTSTITAATNLSDSTVTWSSDNTSVATVDGGTVTAVKAGSATIKATFSDGHTESASVTVNAKSYTYSLSHTSLSLTEGETSTITASTDLSDKTVTWSSDNTSVATVDGGTVTAVKAGNATITAKFSDGTTKTTSVTVNAKSYTYSVSKESVSLTVGSSETITATTSLSDSTVTWTSADASIATVSGGTITAVKAGTTTVTAKFSDGTTKSISVSVSDKTYEISSVTLTVSSKSVTSMSVGTSGTLSGVTNPTGGTVTYTSSDESIISISDTTATAKAIGTATITATCGKNTKTLSVKVVAASQTITLSSETLTILTKGTSTLKATVTGATDSTITWTTSDKSIATVDSGKVTGVAVGTATITATLKENTSVTATCKVTVTDSSTTLKDKNGNTVYVAASDGSGFRVATAADYDTATKFFIQVEGKEYKYTGWQTIDGYTYFFDKNNNFVTGDQVIQGVQYSFDSEGHLAQSSGVLGIDVSKWNGSIDWSAVKNSGVSYVIIRCGYRGSSTGALIEDPKFRTNISGASAAGLKVGVYFFTQAINDVEAVEEASMVLSLIKGYNISCPVFLDVETSNGRADSISVATRTAVCKAFCATIKNAGYSSGVYANKTWFTNKIDVSQLTSYKIWLAQYASTPTYTKSRYDMWQYSSSGSISGISGRVDMNISYISF